MFIIGIFLLIGILYKREIKTIISFLFLGFVVMYFWEEIKMLTFVLSFTGFGSCLVFGIILKIKKDKRAKKLLLISLLCFLILSIVIATDDTSKSQTEQYTTKVQTINKKVLCTLPLKVFEL